MPYSGKDCFSNMYPCCRPLCERIRSEEHTSELQSQSNLVCRLLLEKKKTRLTHQGDGAYTRSAIDRAALPPPTSRGSPAQYVHRRCWTLYATPAPFAHVSVNVTYPF